MHMKFRTLAISLVTSMTLLSSPTFAKEIKLFDQPNTSGKEVGTVDLASGVIPIYTPQASDWTKIADPRNGNVGWVKSNELKSDANNPTSITFTQKIVRDGTPRTYQFVQFGDNPAKPLSKDQAIEYKQWQNEQKAMQQAMEKQFQMMQADMEIMNHEMMHGFPMMVPVIVMPVQKAEQSKPAATPAKKINSAANMTTDTKTKT